MSGEHVWSGWPGAYCLRCGVFDLSEECATSHEHAVLDPERNICIAAGESWWLLEPSGGPGMLKSTTDTFTQSERAFQASVIAYARMMGWQAWHDVATNAPRACRTCKQPLHLPRNEAGFLDLILIRRPRIVWAELKSERGKLTDDQRAWIDELRACGQAVYVWRPSNWQEVERVLR